jgi:hypothetical protein
MVPTLTSLSVMTHQPSSTCTFLAFRALILFCFSVVAFTGCGQSPSTKILMPKGDKPRFEKIGNDICRDTLSGLMWQTGRSRKISDRQKAEQYAANLKTGGFSDWRLPSQGEFYTLHILFFLKRNGACRIRYKGSYWSEKPGLSPRPGRWASPDYTCGPIFDFEETKSGFVRAVRP